MSSFVRVPDFQSVQREWLALLPSCAVDTLFLTPQWQAAWHRALGQEWEPLLLRLDCPTTRGVAALVRRGDTLALPGGTDVCDYHELVVPRGAEGTFYPALARALASEAWHTLVLTSLPEGGPTLEHLPAAVRAQGWTVEVAREDVAPGLALPPSWDEYLAGLSKKDRHELRRKLRRLEGAGPYRAYVAPPGEERLPQDLDDFFTLMRRSDHHKDEFLTPSRERFFRAMALEMARWGYLRLFFLEVEGRRVAAALCFDYRGQRLLYNSGFDPGYSHLSVGLLLKALCIRDAIEQGLAYFDFLRGDEPYKYDLGGVDRALYQVTVRRGPASNPPAPSPQGGERPAR